MKVRVTIMTENNVPVSALGENPKAMLPKIEEAWRLLLAMINLSGECPNEDKATLESVEIVEEGEQ